jgi:hypothetical protein
LSDDKENKYPKVRQALYVLTAVDRTNAERNRAKNSR